MIAVALLALLSAEPTLEQAQTCRAHMELLIEDVAREGAHVAGPTWFIRSWWDRKGEAAGAPDDEGEAVALVKADLSRLRTENPDGFKAGRQECVDTAIDAGAVPGMGPG